jgi:hypothetical protein
MVRYRASCVWSNFAFVAVENFVSITSRMLAFDSYVRYCAQPEAACATLARRWEFAV